MDCFLLFTSITILTNKFYCGLTWYLIWIDTDWFELILPIDFIGQHINFFSLALPRNPLILILNDNTFFFFLCLVSYRQKNCQWKCYSPYYSLFSPFLSFLNWNSLFSSVVLETKVKMVLTILIAISCSADITRLSYLLINQESTNCTCEFLF